MENKDKQIYFLCAMPRSGNTLFSSIMNQNPDVVVTPNSITPPSTVNYGNTFPSGSFGYGSPASRIGLANNRQLYL